MFGARAAAINVAKKSSKEDKNAEIDREITQMRKLGLEPTAHFNRK